LLASRGRWSLQRLLALLTLILALIIQPVALAIQAQGAPLSRGAGPLQQAQILGGQESLIRLLFNTTGLYTVGGVLLHAEGQKVEPYIAAYNSYGTSGDLLAPNGTVVGSGGSIEAVAAAYISPTKLALVSNADYQLIIDAETFEWSYTEISYNGYGYTIGTEPAQVEPLPNPRYIVAASFGFNTNPLDSLFEYRGGQWRYLVSLGNGFQMLPVRPADDIVTPIGHAGNITMFAGVNRSTMVGVDVVVYNWSSGETRVIEVNASDPVAAENAVTAASINTVGVRYASVRVPWYVGYDELAGFTCTGWDGTP
jgi:hypothetical protein